MAAIDFKRLMAEELAKAKAKAFGNKKKELNEEKKARDVDVNDGEDLSEFMQKKLDFDETFTKFNPEIHKLPNSNNAYYIPNFLSLEFEQHLLKLIYSAPKSKWTMLKRRKLQCWGGKADTNNLNKFNIEALPLWCTQLCNKLVTDSNIFKSNYNEPNHILINEYNVGQGIMPHKDGPAYFGRVVIISLISTLCINFYEKPPLKNNNIESPAIYQIILEPQSCLIFEYDLYKNLFHTIHECEYDVIDETVGNLHLVQDELCKSLKIGDKLYRKNKRLSLTIRYVYTSNIIRCIDKTIDFLTESFV